jgi:hypothetical protein
MRDTFHGQLAAQAISPSVKSASEDGATISLAGFDSALIVINTGAIVGAGAFSAKLQESSTSNPGDFADVSSADLLGSLPTTLEASTTYRLGYIGSKRKRFVRVVLTKASGTSIALGAVAMLGHPNLQPVAA